MKRIVFVTIFLAFAASSMFAMTTATAIDLSSQEWKFREKGKSKWMPAEVPGAVHTDLLKNKVIEDPFFRDNEKRLQWIGKTDWEYSTTFSVTPDQLSKERIEMLFNGLDTYATVTLNGKEILEADNMFRRWRVDVKPFLKPGANVMKIVFRSPINEVLPRMKEIDYQIPAPNDQGEITSPYTRKAPYHFGWDWGPRLVTSGIWRPIVLEAWDSARIEDFHLRQDSVSKDVASITTEVEVDATRSTAATLRVFNRTDRTKVIEKQVELREGLQTITTSFSVKNPRRWFPVGLGEQFLYDFETELIINGRAVDQNKERTGLRSIELRQKTDKWGKSFEFVVNGIPVFGKGGNWIPADSIQTRVTKKKYRKLMQSFKDANMNMVRVWGGGIYEEDYFYELADEMGLLVWQDFMFGVSMYPGDKKFLANVRAEAIDNVKRLRNHPSIILWCGNNESETAWQHWGWKERLPDVLWENYKKIFLRVLPEVVEDYDPTRAYWSSSPSSDLEDDADSQKSGDVHYWAVWHAEKPFSEYTKQFPRFMSEYGFQSFPDIETVKSYTTKEDRKSIETKVMLAHQRHPRGNQLIREYMLREFNEPKDFESFLYVSQVLQAEGIKLGTEHLRRIMPRNMGALYWQLNDCWPVASWSGTDYFGRWKAMHYYARRFFEPMMVSPFLKEDGMGVSIVSDFPDARESKLKISVFALNGERLSEKIVDVQVEPLKGKEYLSMDFEEILAGRKKNEVFAKTSLIYKGAVVSTNHLYFAPYKELKLTKPAISKTVVKTSKGFEIRLKSSSLARSVHLHGLKDGFFKDNFFDLVPGEEKVVVYTPETVSTKEEFELKLRIRSLADAF